MFLSRLARRRSTAFSVAEVLLAIGLVAVALLALIGQSTLLASAAQKGDDTSVASGVAKSTLDRVAQQVALDQPPGQKKLIWQSDEKTSPFSSLSQKIGNSEYKVEVFVSDVINTTTGKALGSGRSGAENPKTRLKQIETVVTWWDSKTQDRAGYGKLELRSSRLIKVSHEEP